MFLGSGKKDLDTLGLPVDNTIFFAGEALSSAHFGCVHGAWDSGMHTVALLKDKLQLQ